MLSAVRASFVAPARSLATRASAWPRCRWASARRVRASVLTPLRRDAMKPWAWLILVSAADRAESNAARARAAAAANKTAQGAAGGSADAGGAGATAGAADLAKAETLLSAAKNQAGVAALSR